MNEQQKQELLRQAIVVSYGVWKDAVAQGDRVLADTIATDMWRHLGDTMPEMWRPSPGQLIVHPGSPEAKRWLVERAQAAGELFSGRTRRRRVWPWVIAVILALGAIGSCLEEQDRNGLPASGVIDR